MVLFYKYHADVIKQGGRHKADKETEKRLICTIHTSHYDAKNRYGMEAIINAGKSAAEACESFLTALRNGQPA